MRHLLRGSQPPPELVVEITAPSAHDLAAVLAAAKAGDSVDVYLANVILHFELEGWTERSGALAKTIRGTGLHLAGQLGYPFEDRPEESPG